VVPETKVVLVTGAARGIGREIASRLAREGWIAVIGDLDKAGAVEAAASITAEGGLAHGVHLDVTDSKAVEAVVEQAGGLGPVSGLVNNAGVLRDGPLTKMTDEDFRLVLDVCLFGAFRTSRAVAPAMVEAEWGRIVNITSRAYLGNPGQANYSAAKAGLVGLTKALAKELGRHQITVNAIAPGMTDTEMVRAHPKSAEIIARAAKANSIHRIGLTADIAAAAAYLFAEDAGFITGDVLHVTGGRFG
jgi:3-oxoacyl-[acyl-carrier protein] reductase